LPLSFPVQIIYRVVSYHIQGIQANLTFLVSVISILLTLTAYISTRSTLMPHGSVASSRYVYRQTQQNITHASSCRSNETLAPHSQTILE